MMITLEKGNNIAYITLNRIERLNALNADGYVELRDILEDISEDPEVLVAILKAEGKSFCAGSDISDFVKDNIIELRKHFEKIAVAFKGISECKKIIIAAVHGYALGGGCALAASADFTIASEDATFGLPEVNIDLYPMTIMPPIMRAVHYRQAMELLFTGVRVNAQRAYEIGLVNKVVPRENLLDTVQAMAEKFCSISPFALETGKKGLQISQSMEYFSSIDYLSNMMTMLTSHDRAQKKIKDFLNSH
jgi:enoyl-CoA hydratase/carnithine racemase